jgi:hypothetical protein
MTSIGKCTTACTCSATGVETVCVCGCVKCRKRRSRQKIKNNGSTKRKFDHNVDFSGPVGQCGSPVTFVEFEYGKLKQGKGDILSMNFYTKVTDLYKSKTENTNRYSKTYKKQ